MIPCLSRANPCLIIPRYEKAGIDKRSFLFVRGIRFVKLDYAYRRVGDSTLNNEGTANLTLGWIY